MLHPNLQHLVPPFPGSISKLIGTQSPLVRAGGKILPLIAFQGQRPVGRIAAILNRAHNEYYQDRTGFFGFFDFVQDEKVAEALLKEAEAQLLSWGCGILRGPYSPSVNDECGLLVEGFDSAPMILMPFNPDYYQAIYSRLGLNKVRDLYAYYLTSDLVVPEKIKKVVERVKKRSGVSFRNIDLKNLDAELRVIQELYNGTLKRNWGFVPISFEELKFASEDLKQIIKPDLVMIAEKEGVPVGFSMLLPNMNEFMLKSKKHSGLLRVLNFVWQLKTRTPSEARLAVLGVKPKFENAGIPAVFYWESIQRGRKSFKGGELSWIEESNIPMMRSLELMGAKKYKTYSIFEKPI